MEQGITIETRSLHKRIGRIIVSRNTVLEANAQTLKELFSNFFPLDANRAHAGMLWDSIEYYGVSPHFDEVEEACWAPRYNAILTVGEDGLAKFDRFEKLDT